MIKNKLILGLSILAVILLCISAGCINDNSSSDMSSTLVYAGENVNVINPLIDDHAEIIGLIFSGLMKYDRDSKPVYDLAESCTYDAAAMTYTFKLKHNVKWHDGETFNADDVVFTYNTLINDKSLSSDITSNYEDIKSVRKIDDYTVEFVMKQYNAAILGYLTIGIVPEHLLKGKDMNTDSFNQNPIGTGKYKFVEWDRTGNMIILESNKNYYGKIPNIERIIFKKTNDKTTKTTMLKTGEADLAWLNAEYADQFRGVKGYKNFDFITSDFRSMTMSMKNDFWKKNPDSIGVLGYAIDKDKIVETVLRNRGVPAYSVMQYSDYGGNKEADIYKYDVKKFHEEMEKLGWKRGSDGIYERNGQKFHFELFVPLSEEERVDIAQLCAKMLTKEGIDIELKLESSWDHYLEYDGFLAGEAVPFDPDKAYNMFATGASGNNNGYSNAEVDKWLTAARHETDDNARKYDYQQFEKAYAENPSMVLIAYLDGNYVGIDGINGIDTKRVLGHHAVGVMWNIEEWTLTK